MALRKQPIKDVSSESQQMAEDSQEDKASADRDDGEELSSLLLSPSSTREKRRKAGDKSKPKEMTEEEMMDFALRLSEQEASVTALQQQQEEEAVMKAIQESMVGQTSASHSLLTDPSLRLGSRRKLSYPNGEKPSDVNHSCTPDPDPRSAQGNGEESIIRNKKRKWRAGSPLLEMPALSQTQKIYSQASPCRSESSSAPLDSPQSSDSTQIDDSQIQKSPVFPLTGCRAAVQVDRLSHNLVETCRNSGFVLCSQDTWTLTQKSDQPKSPTFPQSDLQSDPKSSVFPEVETEQSAEYVQSPVFGRNAQHESPSACKRHASVCSPTCENAGLLFSSQESLRLSVRSGCPESPVFPKSPAASNTLPASELLALSEGPERGQTEQSPPRSVSPVFGTSAPQQRRTSTSAAELRGPNCEPSPSDGRKDTESEDPTAVTRSPDSEEPNETSKECNSAATQLTSDMTLVWSGEEEEDATPVGSPSPVFPEEKPSHRAEDRAASLNHVAAASVGTTGPNRSPSPPKSDSDRRTSPTAASSSSSTSTGRQLLSTTEAERPLGRELPPPEEPSDGHAVHYYWGVPFCPRGLDPDRYTQVIVAQMEVYEKSLKEAQRRLLRKAEWGEAVLPQPEKCPSPEEPAESPHHHLPRRRGLRLRGIRTSEAADSLVRAEEDGKKEEEELREKHEDNNERDDEQMDCEVCPETQLSDDSTQDLTIVTDAAAEPASKSPDLTEIILRDDSPAGDEPREELADGDEKKENIPGCSSAAAGQTGAEGKEDRRHPDVEEVKDRSFPPSASPDLEPAVVPHSPQSSVDCPICQASFPAAEIEMHAAYCDGEVAVLSERRPESHRVRESLKHRGKRWRRAERTAEATNELPNACRNQEKCYICQKTVPLSDYERHIDLCLRGSRCAARGSLLSALEQTESRDSEAGPSGSKPQPEAVIDLRDDDDDEDGGAAAFRISNSPIRSFTPISEASGCLIDFRKQQRAKKPSQRRR
ncbi:uncharacterized protein [Leuresthes tenuis]|uniref:uncharacterized protein isoform X2 n=1 Tax=Leuresthes tenuis TaxID=355514 RepID=UPI003B504787